MRELAARSVRSFGEVSTLVLRGMHLHSLDAVLVAMVWQSVFSIAYSGSLAPLPHVTALALIVWLVYTADRLLDARSLAPKMEATDRHRHHFEHWQRISKVWFGCLFLLIVLVTRHIERGILFNGMALGSFVLLYGSLVHVARTRCVIALKEFQVAILFAAGASIGTWASPVALRFANQAEQEFTSYLLSISLVAGMFFLNCSRVSFAEHTHDPFQGEHSLQGILLTSLGIDHESFLRSGTFLMIVSASLCGLLGHTPNLIAISVVIGCLTMGYVGMRLTGTAKRQWTGLAMDLAIALPPLVIAAMHRLMVR